MRVSLCLLMKQSVTKLRITPKCMCALSVATPMSLQQLSRLALRRELGTKALKVIGQLHIPKLIISYLCYEWASARAHAGGAEPVRPVRRREVEGSESWSRHGGWGASAGEKIRGMDTRFRHKHISSCQTVHKAALSPQERLLEAEAKIGKSCFSPSRLWIFTSPFICAGKDFNLFWF